MLELSFIKEVLGSKSTIFICYLIFGIYLQLKEVETRKTFHVPH